MLSGFAKQAVALDNQCESDQDAIAGLRDLIALLQEDYAQRIRQMKAQIVDFKKRIATAKADAAELRQIASQIEAAAK